jgi:hypothetical protein
MVNAVMLMVSERARGSSPYKSPDDRDKDIAAILDASEAWGDESDFSEEFVTPTDFMEAWFRWYADNRDAPSAGDLVALQREIEIEEVVPETERQWRAYLDKYGFNEARSANR